MSILIPADTGKLLDTSVGTRGSPFTTSPVIVTALQTRHRTYQNAFASPDVLSLLCRYLHLGDGYYMNCL